jgi:hypothetical protein
MSNSVKIPPPPTTVILPRVVIPPRPVSPVRITLPPRPVSPPRTVSPRRVIVPQRPVSPTRVTTPTQSPKPVTPQTPIDDFVNTVIREQDADIPNEKEYQGYINYLLNAEDKYNIFARIYPDSTCLGVSVRVEVDARYVQIRPVPDSLVDCVYTAANRNRSVGVKLSYRNHANSLWFDTINLEINRYDPQVSGQERDQPIIDNLLRTELANLFPDYTYLGNTLEPEWCVQGIRSQGRRYKADYFCQDYSLLYDIRRAQGMTHEQAAWDLVEKRDTILEELRELLLTLAYRKRLELGRSIPVRYQY